MNRLIRCAVWWWPWAAAIAVILTAWPGFAAAQGFRPNVKDAKPQINVEDKDDFNRPDSKIWVLNFSFKEPRLITVDIPGRGRSLCWYLKYEIINRTGAPRIY